MTIHILPLPARAVDPVTAQIHALFLCHEAIALGDQSPALRQTIEQLCRSENAAIAHKAFALLAPLRMLK